MISPEVISKVLKIFFAARKPVENIFAGEYKSVFKGSGIEFEEVREYIPGDDVRNINWHITAKWGKPFIKKFVEERELTIIILLDSSASVNFGSVKSKRELAAEFTSLIAWSAIINNDKIGLLAFSDRVEKFIRPQKGRQQILKLIREVLTHIPRGKQTNLAQALQYTYKMIKKRAVVFVVSDFFADGWERPFKILSQKHKVVPVVIGDKLEENFDVPGSTFVEDFESGKFFLFSPGREKKFLFEKMKTAREKVFKEAACRSIFLSTEKPLVSALFHFFRGKGRL